MPAPTGPINITVTLSQQHLDAIWVVKEKFFPEATNEEILTKLQEWSIAGIRRGLSYAISDKSRELAEQDVTDFNTSWDQ